LRFETISAGCCNMWGILSYRWVCYLVSNTVVDKLHRHSKFSRIVARFENRFACGTVASLSCLGRSNISWGHADVLHTPVDLRYKENMAATNTANHCCCRLLRSHVDMNMWQNERDNGTQAKNDRGNILFSQHRTPG
ncbi:unnamed protein product, partial [Ectocarpus sp. 8 AP-2014]